MKILKDFRFINKVEGYSFLALLFIAMPLKYVYGIPMATKIAGMIHGGLFIWFVISLVNTYNAKIFATRDAIKFFILSLVPFGTFYTESTLKKRFDTI
jgi:integral membrane protein